MITHEVAGDRIELSISGELNVNSLQGIRTKVEGYNLERFSEIVVDLNKVTFLDSSGMGFLVVLIKNARSRGANVSLRDPRPSVRRMLGAIRIDRFVSIVDPDGKVLNQAELDEQGEVRETE